MVLEKLEKELTNCDKISHCQQFEESGRLLLEINSFIHSMARLKSHVAIHYDELIHFSDINESDCEDESSDFNMVNPDLMDFNVVSSGGSNQCYSFSHC